jgi:type VI secretion system secreted protein VgrG
MATEASIVQTGRSLILGAPLGDDVLIPTGFQGEEGLSRLFSYRIEAVSSNQAIQASDLLGNPVSLTVARPDGDPRLFHGRVTAFSAGPVIRDGYRQYSLVLSPWLWLLGRRSDCRIFQAKTSKDIISTLFAEAGFSDYQFNLQGTPVPRDYCVQFGETSLAFISRLLEEEGYFYFFNHSADAHTLVIADEKSVYADCDDATAVYRPGGRLQLQTVHEWRNGWSFTSGKWTVTDYNFEQPDTQITSTVATVLPVSAFNSWERYEYPGFIGTNSDAGTQAKLRMEAEEASFQRAEGAGSCASFRPGTKFTLDGHAVSGENTSYVLVGVRHEAADNIHFTAAASDPAQRPYYRNTFVCMPSTVTFRPERTTPRPSMNGPQTALVVGASGQEIYCDQYGRIRIQFFWDREGVKDDKSSCWVRVAQSIGGKSWGGLMTPRVGMEVVVDFLDGNPDRPLITGVVYNANNMPPWALPDNKTRSGFVSRSSTGGSTDTANELRFEDKTGSEQILFHAEKDFLREVENDDTLTVGHDQSIDIKNNRTATIEEGNDSLTVSKGNRSATVTQGDDTLAVSAGKRTVTVEGNLETTVKSGDHKTTVSTGNQVVTVSTGDQTVTISTGNQKITASAGKISVEAMQGIELKCGSNSVVLDQTGITIKGLKIALTGDMQVDIKGAMTTVNGDATVTIKGGMVMIN